MKKEFTIENRAIGASHPCFCVAEMSGNHLKDYSKAVEIIHAAKEAGADAIKLQTYTADSLSVDSDKEWFQIHGGALGWYDGVSALSGGLYSLGLATEATGSGQEIGAYLFFISF